MFDDWRKRRRLQQELRRINNDFLERYRTADKRDPDVQQEYEGSTADVLGALRGIETQRARRKAERFGIDIPPFDFDEQAVNWEMLLIGRPALTATAIAKINRQVTEARFAYWKRWVEILIPVLSLLVSLVLALVALGK